MIALRLHQWTGWSVGVVCLIALAGVDPAQAAGPLQNQFGQRLLRALEFVDYPDMLVAVAARNTQPWARYDRDENRLIIEELFRMASSPKVPWASWYNRKARSTDVSAWIRVVES